MTLVNGFRDHHNGFVEADFQVEAKGLVFCTDRGVKFVGTVHEKWRCVPGIVRLIFLPFLPQGDNSTGTAIGTLLVSILLGPVHRSFCLFRTGAIDMHQKVSHCNVHPFTAA